MIKKYLEFRQKIVANNNAELCRFCLEKSIKNKSAAVSEITNTKMSNLFKKFTDMDFNLSLIHPYTFCETCINALEASVKFREHLRRVETFWNQYIGEMETMKTENDSIVRILCGKQILQSNIEKKNKSIENDNFLIEHVNNTNPKPPATTSKTSIIVEPLPEAEHIELPDFIEYHEDFDNDRFDEMPEIPFVSTTIIESTEDSTPPRKKTKLVSPLAMTTPKPKTTTTRKRKSDKSNALPAEIAAKTMIARHNSEVDEDGEYIDEPKFDFEKESITKENGIAVKCTKCYKEFKSKHSFVRHKRLEHPRQFDAKFLKVEPDIPIMCNMCDQIMPTISKLAAHQRVKHKKMFHFECYICKRTHSAKRMMQIHFESSHNTGDGPDGINTMLCHICGVILSHRNVNRHLRTTHRNGQIGKMRRIPNSLLEMTKCSFCTQLTEFRLKKDLDEHVRTVHPDKYRLHLRLRYPQNYNYAIPNSNSNQLHCTVCLMQNFMSKFELDEHMKDHFQYECDKCLRKFAAQHLLDSHYGMHSNLDRPFKCSECSATFTRETHVRSHYLRKHSTERAYKCDKCDRAFAQNYELIAHKKNIHLRIKPYKCMYCERAYPTKSALTQHLPSHTGVYNHNCHMCHRKFYSGCTLNTHIAMKHGMKIEILGV